MSFICELVMLILLKYLEHIYIELSEIFICRLIGLSLKYQSYKITL
jgi:hypothetical protein